MASAMEPVVKNPTGGCFAKVHDVFTLTKGNSDIPSSVSQNTNTAFSSFKKPGKAPAASETIGGLDRPKTFCASTNSESNYGEPTKDDGPCTPMRYLPRPKYVNAETPDSTDSLPSLSLATGSSCHVGKQLIKQEGPELPRVDLFSPSFAKPQRGMQSVLKAESPNVPRLLFSPDTSNMLISDGIDMLQPNLYQQMPLISNIPQACSTIYSAVSLPSVRTISGRVNSPKHSLLDVDAKQEIVSSDSQQMAETTEFPQITPRSVNRVPCMTRQPVSHTFRVLQSEDKVQGNTSRWKYKMPACTTNQCSNSTTNSNQVESQNYMPILQTPLVASVDGCRPLSAEKNLSFSNNFSPVFGKKRKLISQKHCIPDSAGALVGPNQCLLKGRVMSEDAENDHLEAERVYHKKQQVIRPPNSGSVSNDCMKKHRVLTNNVGNIKSVNGFADFQSTNNFGKLRHLEESVALKLNGSSAIDSSVRRGPVYSSRLDVHGHSHSEPGQISETSLLQSAKAEPLSNEVSMGNTTKRQTPDGQSQPLGLRLLTFPAYAPMPSAVSTFSSGSPSLPQYTNHPGNSGNLHTGKKLTPRMPSQESDWGKFLALSATADTSVQVDEKDNETLLPYQKRFIRLQAFLKQCDEQDQESLNNLRSLSAAARSGHAVELETRAIMLSLEEGKEINRMKMLDIFAKNFPNRQKGQGAHCARLPAAGSANALKLVSNR
eukprot:Gb_16933 [translate_table: standard]